MVFKRRSGTSAKQSLNFTTRVGFAELESSVLRGGSPLYFVRRKQELKIESVYGEHLGFG